MRRLVLAVSWLLVSTPIVTAQAPAVAPRAASPNESAARTEAMRRYESLLANNSPALEGRRDELMFRLGLLYFEEAQATAPGGGGYDGRDRYDRALSLFGQVLAKPGTIFREDALYYQAIGYEATGRAEQALTSFRTLARDFPASQHGSEIWFRVGNDAVQKNRIAEAANAYQEVLRRADPVYRDQSAYMYAWSAFSLRQDANARTTLLDLLQRFEAAGQQQQNLYNESVELLAKVVRSEGNTALLSGPWVGPRPAFAPVVLKRTADLFRETSAYREAAMTYEQLMRDYPDPATADATEKLAIECYMKAGDQPRAEEARERLIARHTTRGQLGADAADLLPILKDSALYLHRQARDTKSPDFYRRAVDAYQAFAASVAEGPTRSEALFYQAEALKEAGDWSNAAERYKVIAQSRDPAHGEEAAFRRVALLEDAKGRGLANVATVLAVYSDYLTLYPGGAHEMELRTRQTGYLFDDKQYADSLKAGVQVVTREADPAKRQKMKLLLARAAYSAGDYFQCANWATQLLNEPGLPADMRSQGEEVHAASILKAAESLKDKPLDAASQYELLALRYPRHPSAAASLYNAAILLRDNGDKTRALGLLRQLIEKYPQGDLFRDATVAATDIYKQTGDSVGAADVLERAAAHTSDPAESANLILEAANRARAANSAQAVTLYEKYLRLHPASDLSAATARSYVAKAYARQGRLPEAERLAREAISHAPMGGSPQETQQGQLTVAEAYLILGDASLNRFEALRLSEPLATSLKRKQQALDEALENLRAAANYGFADVSLASYYKIGYAQLDFANAVMQAPHPRSLGPEQRIQYDSMLRDQMRPYREGAEKAFRITLEQAKTASVENEWTARARSALLEFGGERAPAAAAPGPAVAPAGGSQAVPVLVPPSGVMAGGQ